MENYKYVVCVKNYTNHIGEKRPYMDLGSIGEIKYGSIKCGIWGFEIFKSNLKFFETLDDAMEFSETLLKQIEKLEETIGTNINYII